MLAATSNVQFLHQIFSLTTQCDVHSLKNLTAVLKQTVLLPCANTLSVFMLRKMEMPSTSLHEKSKRPKHEILRGENCLQLSVWGGGFRANKNDFNILRGAN
jgi:hypothetical protein